MAFGNGRSSITYDDILNKTTEIDILSFYLDITEIPCIIRSPLRDDKKPSFGLYSKDGNRIFYIDFATGDSGGVYDLLSKMWGMDFSQVLGRIDGDIPKFSSNCRVKSFDGKVRTTHKYNKSIDLQCKIREWREYDIEYWESYGVSIEWLKYAEVYPISHKIIIKNNKRYVFGADKYAYAYVERKEGRITLKIYQPFNKKGYKWSNKHDFSVISLWTKVPEYGDNICICSSLKDALCLWSNVGIPSLAIQGEGYKISETAIKELKRRYKNIFILFDNDEAGIMDGEKLSSLTGFTNIVLPQSYGEKDISDLYHSLQDKEKFKKIMTNLFNK